MRVIVVHEDGDRTDRVTALAGELCAAVAKGSMRYQGVGVEIRDEMDALTVRLEADRG